MANTAISGLFIGLSLVIWSLLFVWYILQIIACWRIFTKGGERGWKSLIPIYSTYIQYKLTWNSQWFLVTLICVTLNLVFSNSTNMAGAMVSSIASIVALFVHAISYFKLSQAFGHGIGFGIGLIFLNPIFMLILGFGESEYQGPQ